MKALTKYSKLYIMLVLKLHGLQNFKRLQMHLVEDYCGKHNWIHHQLFVTLKCLFMFTQSTHKTAHFTRFNNKLSPQAILFTEMLRFFFQRNIPILVKMQKWLEISFAVLGLEAVVRNDWWRNKSAHKQGSFYTLPIKFQSSLTSTRW